MEGGFLQWNCGKWNLSYNNQGEDINIYIFVLTVIVRLTVNISI